MTRGVILAGGSGKRLAPLTLAVNKHLLPVGKEPMIFHAVGKLVRAGIKDILVVTGVEHAGGVFQLLGSGKDFGASFSFKVQDESGGIAQALRLAKDFVRNEPFCCILGDNIFQAELGGYIARFLERASTVVEAPCGMILLKKVEDPERYGVAVITDGEIADLIEKPKAAPTNLAVTGVYFYRGASIFDYIDSLRPSARGELEVTELNLLILKHGRLFHEELEGFWTDAGEHASLWKASYLLHTTNGALRS